MKLQLIYEAAQWRKELTPSVRYLGEVDVVLANAPAGGNYSRFGPELSVLIGRPVGKPVGKLAGPPLDPIGKMQVYQVTHQSTAKLPPGVIICIYEGKKYVKLTWSQIGSKMGKTRQARGNTYRNWLLKEVDLDIDLKPNGQKGQTIESLVEIIKQLVKTNFNIDWVPEHAESLSSHQKALLFEPLLNMIRALQSKQWMKLKSPNAYDGWGAGTQCPLKQSLTQLVNLIYQSKTGSASMYQYAIDALNKKFGTNLTENDRRQEATDYELQWGRPRDTELLNSIEYLTLEEAINAFGDYLQPTGLNKLALAPIKALYKEVLGTVATSLSYDADINTIVDNAEPIDKYSLRYGLVNILVCLRDMNNDMGNTIDNFPGDLRRATISVFGECPLLDLIDNIAIHKHMGTLDWRPEESVPEDYYA